MSLPTGVVTFLLTDVEGSTRLWSEHPEAMANSLARHDAIIADATAQFDGRLLKPRGEGDSTFAVFARATDAVSCAAAIQAALWAEDWVHPVDLRVRAALHTGEAEYRDDDYFGAEVNRAARIRAIAHGGQTILSQSTADLVRDHLAGATTLKDLGAHRLKDLTRPERIYQLTTQGFPEEFPPLRSLEGSPNNLPVQRSTFIGRADEMAELRKLISTTRLLTLTGAAGCGKTRLAIQTAAELTEDYPDGVWLIDLGGHAEPERVAEAIGAAMSLRDMRSVDLHSLIGHIGLKNMLLLMDNCEHLIDACASAADALLQGCPDLRIMATSREPLEIPGESLFRVPPLSIPDQHRPATIATLDQYEAVRLFIDRALQSRARFQVTNNSAPFIAQICTRLDGIPLAIELAAARLRHLTPQQICDGLADRFHLLTGGGRMAMPRQQTLEASIDWSHGLLTEPERTLLRRLAVFPRGFTLEAGHRVAAADGIEDADILDLLGHLVDKSLVVAEEEPEGVRYRLLESIREYALRRLQDSGELETMARRHRDFYLEYAERSSPSVEGTGQRVWQERLEAEHDNVRAALRWSLERAEAGPLLRLARAMAPFWTIRGYWQEGRAWLEDALQSCKGDTELRLEAARTRMSGYYMAVMLRDAAEMTEVVREVLPALRDAGDRWWLGRALTAAAERRLITLMHHAADVTDVREGLREGVRIAREMGDAWGVAWALCSLGWTHVYDGDLAAGRRYFDEGLAVASGSGNTFVERLLLRNRGHLEMTRGALDEARRVFEAGVATARTTGDRVTLSQHQMALGTVLLLQGDTHTSRAVLEEALEVVRDLGTPADEGMILRTLGAVALSENRSSEAIQGYEMAAKLAATEPAGLSATMTDLARAHLIAGDVPAARAAMTVAETAADEAQSLVTHAGSLYMLARIEQAAGNPATAETCCRRTIALYNGDYPLTRELAEVIELLAGLLAARGEHPEAAVLLGGAGMLRTVTGAIRHPHREDTFQAVVRDVRAGLGAQAFEGAWADGSALSVDELMNRAAGDQALAESHQTTREPIVDRRALGRGPILW